MRDYNLVLSKEQAKAMDLNTREKVQSACQGKSMKETQQKTFSEVIREDPTHARLAKSMVGMRKCLCFKCADLLHYELVRLQIIPNNPSWIPFHQRQAFKREREFDDFPKERNFKGFTSSSWRSAPVKKAPVAPRNLTESSKVKTKKAIRQKAAQLRENMYEAQEAMVAEMRVQEPKVTPMSWADEVDAEEAKQNIAPVEKSDFDKCLESLDKLSDQLQGIDDEDDLGDFSDSELDLLVTDADLHEEQITFGTMEPTNLDCMVMTLPREFSANHDPQNTSSGMANQVSVVNMSKVPMIDRHLSEAEISTLVKALFVRKGIDNEHNKPLYIKVKLEGKSVHKVLIDNGATANIVPIAVLQMIGKSEEDIVPNKISVTGFAGTVEYCEGTISLSVKVGSLNIIMPFFVVRSITSYNALLGRSWLHKTYSIPSSLHQLLVMWNGRRYEIIHADLPSVEINVSMLNDRCGATSAVELVEIVNEIDDEETNSLANLERLQIEEMQEDEEVSFIVGNDPQALRLLPFKC